MYGTTGYILAVSTFLAGYRQIRLAFTIQTIVKSGDLVAENIKKKSDKLFFTLIISLSIYFVIYLLITGFIHNGDYVVHLNVSYNVINSFFTFMGLLLYFCTIMMLRNAINQCTTFQFEIGGTYVICGLYGFILFLQIFYLLSY